MELFEDRGISRREVLMAAAATTAAGATLAPDALAGQAPDASGPDERIMQGIKRGKRYRIRELGVIVGRGTPGPFNAITDVPGVRVGYKTLQWDKPRVANTGVTIIEPRNEPMWGNYAYGGYFSFNGNGEMTGQHWVDESGWLTSAIGITNTHQVGIVRDTLVKVESERNPDLSWRLPVVAETYDGGLSDIDAFHVTEQHVREALADVKSGVPAEGNVGGGTGMSCYGFKGGSGTSSRVVPYEGKTYHVGVFVQTNFGSRGDLKINGAPVGAELIDYPPPSAAKEESRGSCILVVATDAPMVADQCRRLAIRSAIGMGRTGAIGSNGDGDIVFAFSTGNEVRPGQTDYEVDSISNDRINPFFNATIEATMEAIYNSMTKAETVHGFRRDRFAIPLDKMIKIMKKYKAYPLEYPPT